MYAGKIVSMNWVLEHFTLEMLARICHPALFSPVEYRKEYTPFAKRAGFLALEAKSFIWKHLLI